MWCQWDHQIYYGVPSVQLHNVFLCDLIRSWLGLNPFHNTNKDRVRRKGLDFQNMVNQYCVGKNIDSIINIKSDSSNWSEYGLVLENG